MLDRLNAGPVLCAEGYLFELERRGYLQAGAFVPEVAEALGRRPPASQYSPDMSKHYALGNDPTLRQTDREFVAKL